MVGVIVAGIAAVTLFTIRTGTGTANKAARPAATTATTKALSGPAGELVRLVQRGQAVNLDVAYATTATSTATAHLWRRGPLGRLDNESGSGDGAVRNRQLVTASGPLACTQTGSLPWSCTPQPGLDIADIGVVSPALVATLSALDVKVHDDRVLGQAVRCFTVARPNAAPGAAVVAGEAANLCLTSDGIPVRLELGPTHLEAVSLDRARPPDSVFKPPA